MRIVGIDGPQVRPRGLRGTAMASLRLGPEAGSCGYLPGSLREHRVPEFTIWIGMHGDPRTGPKPRERDRPPNYTMILDHYLVQATASSRRCRSPTRSMTAPSATSTATRPAFGTRTRVGRRSRTSPGSAARTSPAKPSTPRPRPSSSRAHTPSSRATRASTDRSSDASSRPSRENGIPRSWWTDVPPAYLAELTALPCADDIGGTAHAIRRETRVIDEQAHALLDFRTGADTLCIVRRPRGRCR